MAGKVLNVKVWSPLKLPSGLTGKCHYSYNLPLAFIVKNDHNGRNLPNNS